MAQTVHYSFKGEVNYNKLSDAFAYIESSTLAGATPPKGKLITQGGCQTFINETDQCDRNTVNQSCQFNHPNKQPYFGTCTMQTKDIKGKQGKKACIYKCMKDYSGPVPKESRTIKELYEYWNTDPEVNKLEKVSKKDNYWTIGPTTNIPLCGPMCKDTNPKCLTPTEPPKTFCDPTQYKFHSECCVCNPKKWDMKNKFIGQTTNIGKTTNTGTKQPYTTSYPIHNGYSLNNTIPQKVRDKLKGDGVNIGKELMFKRVGKGYKRPYTSQSNHLCYVPIHLKSGNTESTDIYAYDDTKNMIKYAFYLPKISTNLTDQYGKSIEYISNPDNHRFFNSKKQGYYEQCLYGNIKKYPDTCPLTCETDMIIDNKNRCKRCPIGKGVMNKTAKKCSFCSDLNKINHPRGFGCKECSTDEYYDSNTMTCKSCNKKTHQVLSICGNKSSTQTCGNLAYKFQPTSNDKQTCLTDPNCKLTEYCVPTKGKSDKNMSKKITLDAKTTKLNYHNLYMNEVCKTIGNETNCKDVPECNWYTTLKPARCLLHIEEPKDTFNKLMIPMAIPPHIGSNKDLNKFKDPTNKKRNDRKCNQPVVGATAGQMIDHLEKYFWDTTTKGNKPDIPKPICPNQDDIHIPNKNTKLPINVYASTKKTDQCQYYGCVSQENYMKASIPETVAPLCQELVNASTYYKSYEVIYDNLNKLKTNPTNYGCLLK